MRELARATGLGLGLLVLGALVPSCLLEYDGGDPIAIEIAPLGADDGMIFETARVHVTEIELVPCESASLAIVARALAHHSQATSPVDLDLLAPAALPHLALPGGCAQAVRIAIQGDEALHFAGHSGGAPFLAVGPGSVELRAEIAGGPVYGPAEIEVSVEEGRLRDALEGPPRTEEQLALDLLVTLRAAVRARIVGADGEDP